MSQQQLSVKQIYLKNLLKEFVDYAVSELPDHEDDFEDHFDYIEAALETFLTYKVEEME